MDLSLSVGRQETKRDSTDNTTMNGLKNASKMEPYQYGSIDGGGKEEPSDSETETKTQSGWLRSTSKSVIGGKLMLLLLFVASVAYRSQQQRQYDEQQPPVALVRVSSSTGAASGSNREQQVMVEDKLAVPNYSGNLKWGDCKTPKPGIGRWGTGQASQCQCCSTSPQCKAAYDANPITQPIKPTDCQFERCQQKYAFPYYYYDMFIRRVMNNQEHLAGPPDTLELDAMNGAKKICDEVSSDMASYIYNGEPNGTYEQMAWVWLTANKDQPNVSRDCPAALIIVAGECQDVIEDGQRKCEATQDPWQTGGGAARGSAQGVYAGAGTNGRCAGAPDVVPDGAISAGNRNFLPYFDKDDSLAPGDIFCHHNQWSGAGFGGGMCAGGLK